MLSTPIYYKNEQWAVTSYGLECLRHSYHADVAFINRIREVVCHGKKYNIPDIGPHLSTKDWVDIDLMFAAVCVAVAVHCKHRKFSNDWGKQLLIECHHVRYNYKRLYEYCLNRNMTPEQIVHYLRYRGDGIRIITTPEQIIESLEMIAHSDRELRRLTAPPELNP